MRNISGNDDKRIQSIYLIETYVYGTNKEIIYRKEEFKFISIKKQYKNN